MGNWNSKDYQSVMRGASEGTNHSNMNQGQTIFHFPFAISHSSLKPNGSRHVIDDDK
jgi:hypothetical protein